MAQRHIFDGYKVVDFTQALAGPGCTRLMAELGAEVIKVEFAPAGDISRTLPWIKDNGRSGYFLQHNRGKQSLCLDPRTPEGRDILKRLIGQADIFIENFAPGVIGRLGLGWDVVHALNPRVIMCSISSFGQTGPLSHLPGYDPIAASYTGIFDNIGYPDGPPLPYGMSIGDISTAVNAYSAIVTALLDRARTNEGQFVEVSLLETYFHMHDAAVQNYTGSKGAVLPTRFGLHHYALAPLGIFKGREKYIYILSIPKDWPAFCKVIEREDLISDPDFATVQIRAQNRLRLAEIIQAWCAKQPDDAAILEKFRAAHLPVAPVLSVPEALNEPHFIEREIAPSHDDRGLGEWRFPRVPMRFPKYPERRGLQAPFLGEHNAQILSQTLGFSPERIAALHASGVLFAETPPAGAKPAE